MASPFRSLAASPLKLRSSIVSAASSQSVIRHITSRRSYAEHNPPESAPNAAREPPRTAPRSQRESILLQQMQRNRGREQFKGKQHEEESIDEQPDVLVPRYRSPADRAFERKAIGIVVVFFLTFIPFLYWYYPIRKEQVRARRERVMREVAEARALYNEGRR